MPAGPTPSFTTPREGDLGLQTLSNAAGLAVSLLPNGTIFAIEHRAPDGTVMLNQVLGSPLQGGIGRIVLRIGGGEPRLVALTGPQARGDFACGTTSCRWQGEAAGFAYAVTLALHPSELTWFWQVEIAARGEAPPCDLLHIQDIGLGGRGFLMGSEAYVSQYLDHHVAQHPLYGPVIMSRQAQAQNRRYPWLAQGCLDGAAAFATDAIQVFGPTYRLTGEIALPFGTDLPSLRLQHEAGCAGLQSRPLRLSAGETARLCFFALHVPDHPDASGDGDLARLEGLAAAREALVPETLAPTAPVRSLVQEAPALAARPLDAATIERLWPTRLAEERVNGEFLSFFVPEGAQNRHIVLAAKDGLVARRHGALVRSGQGMSLDEETLCATFWMHGVFAAQLTIGNTSFHKLFSVSRDAYNITRTSGLRMLVDTGLGWKLLGVPSAFDIGLSDARWIYLLDDGTVIDVEAIADGASPALQWRVGASSPCRFLAFGHLVLGEREYEQVGDVSIDAAAKRARFAPGPGWLWADKYPEAAYHLTVATPGDIEAIGGDELLHADGVRRVGGTVALRTIVTRHFSFAVSGSMTSAAAGLALAERFGHAVAKEALLAPARAYWSKVTRDINLEGEGPDVEAQNLFLPWLVHDAMIHLTVPHGLEQYTGAAWGTRDVCQGPIELLLSLDHDGVARDILKTVFSEQNFALGDWPQWFMLDPYPTIRPGDSHGDVIVWPLKALCDYLEATDDLALLAEILPWRDDKTRAHTSETASLSAHVEKLLATVRSQFIPGTALIRYGEGDWNDSLQPADPHLRDWMVSSWTVALLYEQMVRYAALQDRAGHAAEAVELSTLAQAMRQDFHRHLVRDGVVAGYGLFTPEGEAIEHLLHPADTRTGLSYSLIPMTQAIIAGLFTPEEAEHHLSVIAQHLAFPDGAHLMDRPVRYTGGRETLFRRAESAAYFGREIGLMYVHAHLRYCEALALDGDAEAFWRALAVVKIGRAHV